MENDEKIALVTGASRGIGRACAIALSQKGYTVLINFAGNIEAAEGVKNEIEKAGGRAFLLQGDVSNTDVVKDLFLKIKKDFGRLDVLVNNAGINRDALLLRLKEENWDAVMNVDLKSDYLMIKSAAPLMMHQRKGSIINISSVVGLHGNVGQVNYAAAKAGVIGLTKACAKEMASRGVRVNAVAPGFIETDMTDKIPEKIREKMISSIPLSRMGKPEDVARVVCFLASDDAGYMTGEVLKVDGGLFM